MQYSPEVSVLGLMVFLNVEEFLAAKLSVTDPKELPRSTFMSWMTIFPILRPGAIFLHPQLIELPEKKGLVSKDEVNVTKADILILTSCIVRWAFSDIKTFEIESSNIFNYFYNRDYIHQQVNTQIIYLRNCL